MTDHTQHTRQQLGRRLKRDRGEAGLTLAQLEARCRDLVATSGASDPGGLSRSSISDIERGAVGPNAEALVVLARALDRPPRAYLAYVEQLGAPEPFRHLRHDIGWSELDGVLPTSEIATAALESEVHDDANPWWSPYGGRWFGDFFAYWWKSAAVDAELISYEVEHPLTERDFAAMKPEEFPEPRAGSMKAAFSSLSAPFLSDHDRSLRLRPLNWGLAVWTQERDVHDSFRGQNPNLALFGTPGLTPYPALAGTHCIVQTSDRWLLLALRAEYRRYVPNTWSVGFEEMVEVGHAPHDYVVADTIRRGLSQEYGLDLKIGYTSLLAVGTQIVRESPEANTQGCTITCAHLESTLEDVWAQLAVGSGRVEDRQEHATWLAIRPTSTSAVRDLLANWLSPPADRVPLATFLNADHLQHPPDQHSPEEPTTRNLHPTSAARLALWARLMAALD